MQKKNTNRRQWAKAELKRMKEQKQATKTTKPTNTLSLPACPRCRFAHCHETTEPDTACASCGFIHCSDQVEDDDHVTVTLPNGEEVELYGDAADLAKQPPRDIDPEWVKLSNAIATIASSDATPSTLKEPVLDFLHSNSGELWGRLIITPPIIQKILIEAAVTESDRKEARSQ